MPDLKVNPVEEDNKIFLTSSVVLLSDFMKGASHSLNYTINTFRKSVNKYVSTSVSNMSLTARRLNSFLSRNGKNHKVVYYILKEDKMEIYITVI